MEADCGDCVCRQCGKPLECSHDRDLFNFGGGYYDGR